MKVDYLVIVPSRSEVPPFFLISPFSSFSLRETEKGNVLLFVSGVGKRKVSKNMGKLRNFSPKHVLVTGFCGSRVKEITSGTIIIGENIICNNQVLDLNNIYTKDIENILKSSNLKWVKEDVECVRNLEVLKEKERPKIVDMESFWIAKEFKERKIPVSFLKAVSDEILKGNKILLPFLFVRFIVKFLRSRKKGLILISDFLEKYFHAV